MSKEEQVRVGNYIEEYLVKSKNIKLVIFLVDIRHSVSENDRLMYDYIIKTNLPVVIVANKADKIAVTKVDAEVERIQNELNPLKDLTFLPFSAERRIYTENMMDTIEEFLREE